MNQQRVQGLAGVGIAGFITIILTWVLKEFFQISIPGEVAQAFTGLFAFAGGWVGSRRGEKT